MNDEKRLIFFYFVNQLLEKYRALQSSEAEKVNRYHVLKMLFLAVIYNENLLGVFNNFYAMINGPVESDCYNYICRPDNNGTKFETFIRNLGDPIHLNQNQVNLIDNSINNIPDYFFHKDDDYLINYTHLFSSWKKSWNKATILSMGSYPMGQDEIINDISLFN